MRRVLIATGAALATGLALLFACGPGDLSDLTRGFPAIEAGEEDGGLPPIPRCRGAVPPDASPSKSAVNELEEQIFAFDNIRVDSKPTGAGILPPAESLNLDDNCSCTQDFSCETLDAGTRATCDPDGGRDNVGGKLLGDLSIVFPAFKPVGLKQRIDQGGFTILVSVFGWNGQADDDSVFVGVRTGTGIDNGLDGGVAVLPLHNGNDSWAIDPASLFNAPEAGTPCTPKSCVPATIDPKAYVVGNKLVAHWPRIDLSLDTGTGTLALPYLGVTLVAELSSTMVDGNVVRRLDGQLAGRWPTSALLAAAGAFAGQGPEFKDLCTNEATFGIYKAQVCASADLASDPAQDNTRGARCGALSEAIRFTAVTARLGTARAPSSTEGSCRKDATCP